MKTLGAYAGLLALVAVVILVAYIWDEKKNPARASLQLVPVLFY